MVSEKCTSFIYDKQDTFYPLANSAKKNKNCLLGMKFTIQTNSNMQNMMVMFTFYGLDWKYPHCGNLT